jgi:glycosyltransferase involved in cell wall biosynthesis
MNMQSTVTTKIVHATECLAAGTMAFLVQATRELARSGVRQVVIFSRRPDTPADFREQFDPRVDLVEVPAPGRAYFRYFKNLRQAIVRQMQDMDDVTLHLHSSKAGFVGRLALIGLRKRPQVFYSPHGLAFLNRRWLLPSLAFRTLEWVAARVDATLVGCSRSEAKLLTGLGGGSAKVLENAVDDSWFHVQRSTPEVPLVVSMGRVCYQKAPEVFAAMATQFQIAEVPARFVWIGDGDPAGEARLRAAGVEVTGWLKRDAVQQLLGQASVYVQTSRWEGMPLSVLQALAAGVPCVVSNAVGNRDAVRQGITGFVVNRLEEGLVCVRRLLHDAELHSRFSEAARLDARKRFSNASFRSRLFRLYRLVPPPTLTQVATPTQVQNVLRPVFSDTAPHEGADTAPLPLQRPPRRRPPLARVSNG